MVASLPGININSESPSAIWGRFFTSIGWTAQQENLMIHRAITLAAIWYTIDQNAPSKPFLIEIDIEGSGDEKWFKEKIIESLMAYAKDKNEAEPRDEYYAPLVFGEVEFLPRLKDWYGDISIEFVDGCLGDRLFVSLPPDIKEQMSN
jgi:hypothetical protein